MLEGHFGLFGEQG